MEGTYELINGRRAAGSVIVTRKGLYYHIRCACFPSVEGMFRLIMEAGDDLYDLGTLVPANGCFMLQTRIAIKTITNGSVLFRLTQQSHKKHYGISICPEEPFMYLSRLESAYLVIHNEKMEIIIRNAK